MLYNYNEAIKLYGTDYKLKKAIIEESIYKIEKVIYSDKKDNYDIYELILKKYPHAFLVKDSALYFFGIIKEMPKKIHLGTNRNALRIHDSRIIQHFYSNLDDKYDDWLERILCSNNIIKHTTENGNEYRIFNPQAVLYDLVRDKKKYKEETFNGIMLAFKDFRYLREVDEMDFCENLYNENIEIDKTTRQLLGEVILSAHERKFQKWLNSLYD